MSKYKNALAKLEALEAKRREQDQLYRELRRSILHEAVSTGELKKQRRSQKAGQFAVCSKCGQKFVPGEEIIDYLDPDGTLVARYHYHPEECRTAAQHYERGT